MNDSTKEARSSMEPMQQEEGAVRLPRVSIDLKIPLWGLLGAAVFVIGSLMSTYYQLSRVADDVNDMKASIRSNNTTTIQFAQEQALLKFRVEKLEQDRERK
jgi:hypothetical protein